MTDTPSPSTWRHDLAGWPSPLRAQWGLAANAALDADPSISWQEAEYRAYCGLCVFITRWESEHPDRPIAFGQPPPPPDRVPGFVFPERDTGQIDPVAYAAFWVAIGEHNDSLPALDWEATPGWNEPKDKRWHEVHPKGKARRTKPARPVADDSPQLTLGGEEPVLATGSVSAAESFSLPAAFAAGMGEGEEASAAVGAIESPPAPVPLEIAAAVIAEVAASEMPPARVIRIVPKPPKVAVKPRGKGKKVNPTGTFDFGE